MSSVKPATTVAELRRAVRQARDDAFLVEPRVVRRMIRELHGFARLSTSVPHTDVLVAARADVQTHSHPDELGLEDFSQLPDLSILVAQPEEYELEKQPVQDLLQLTWARLFHGSIDLTLLQHLAAGTLNRSLIQDSIDQIGQVEFDEAHAVLQSELRVVNPASRIEAYCEFVAVYLQLQRFTPDLLPVWFPSMENVAGATEILTRYLNADALFDSTRLYGAPLPDPVPATMRDEQQLASERLGWVERGVEQPNARKHSRLMRRRQRWQDRGNSVASAVIAMQAGNIAPSDELQRHAQDLARRDIDHLADRLQAALSFRDTDLDDWKKSLWELLQNSTRGFWNSDKRLLYDLQKVCLDHERTVYQVDLVKWIVSRGKRPLRRPLENLREVMMAKHLASSASRLVYVRLSGAERERLAELLHSAAKLAEEQMRDRMRSAVRETMAEVGLHPDSVPEQVASDKMVEEALDCIVERGYLTMGYLRDAISRNDLKLPDLTDPKDLIRGDHLLRSDDRLDVSLDGVYRRGEFYLRWLQVVSSLAFGTRAGRFGTLFIAIPFGGAVIIVVGFHHFVGVLTDSVHKHPPAGQLTTQDDSENAEPSSMQDGVDTVSGDGEVAAVEQAGTGVSETDEYADDAAAETDNAVSELPTVTEGSVETAADLANGGSDDLEIVANSSSGSSGADESGNETQVLDGTESAGHGGTEETTELIQKEPHPVYTWIGDQTPALSVGVGFLLIALIHLPKFRDVCWNVVRYVWSVVKKVVWDLPIRIVKLPVIRQIWRSRWFTKVRRNVVNPLLISWVCCRLIPGFFTKNLPSVWLVFSIGLLLSLAINSRFGRDAEELASEWLANAWHDLRSRFLMALFEWVIDLFKWLLNTLERFLYAVDEWLRFHSGETWPTLVAKAILGVIWSFVSFLIRIYVNLLIEPTLHPVKHFPVVTVAHKIFLPFILVIQDAMLDVLTPYFGLALAGTITWFNILFLPGIFGFLVWELKENWRLYASNRVARLTPVIIASHGEGGARLLKPRFHSGTLPKLFGRLRRLERKEPSFHRFSERRAYRDALEHVERDIRRFVERDLIRLLEYCPVWSDTGLHCRRIHAASNSFLVELGCEQLAGDGLCLLFQEQSGWLVATVSQSGWLAGATPEQQHSLETALRGFYKKAGVELVREQMERRLVGVHPYDIAADGLKIWPERQFDRQITCDLYRRHQIRPWPPGLAASYGLQPVSRELVVFAESPVLWADWQQVWQQPVSREEGTQLPLACLQSARASLLAPLR